MSELAIHTTALKKHFRHVRAVDGIDLEVPRGCVYGFLGRNGAGKTTTIQMLMGMLQPTGGNMSVMGLDPLQQDVEMKRIVSYVPERVQMFDWMTVREIVSFGSGVHPRWDDDEAASLIERLELPLKQKVGTLSRGMQSKLALALAMASHPKLLILDDPTMGLDAVVRRAGATGGGRRAVRICWLGTGTPQRCHYLLWTATHRSSTFPLRAEKSDGAPLAGRPMAHAVLLSSLSWAQGASSGDMASVSLKRMADRCGRSPNPIGLWVFWSGIWPDGSITSAF